MALFYKIEFALVHHHKYSIADLNNLYPYERDIYVEMISQYVEEQNKKRQG